MICPKCMKSVKVIPYGYGYIAICCGNLVYNSKEPPMKEEKDEGRPPQGSPVLLPRTM